VEKRPEDVFHGQSGGPPQASLGSLPGRSAVFPLGKPALTRARRFQTLPPIAPWHPRPTAMRMHPRPDHLRRPRSAWAVMLVLAVAALARGAAAQEQPSAPTAEAVPAMPLPHQDSGARLPAAGEPPPMYIVDPRSPEGFAGIPVGGAADRLPDWPRWFAGANGLGMTRSLPAGAATMLPAGGMQLSTSDASATWPGGVDLHVGRWFGPEQKQAVELIYWGVYGIGSSAGAAAPPPGIIAIPQAPGVTVGTTPASAYLAGGSGQTITRSDLVNDVEINWLYSLGDRPEFLSADPAAPSRPVNLMWLAGFRFFELEDVLTLTSTPSGTAPGTLDLGVATNNNLYGAQVGAKFDWRFMPRLRLAAVPKFLVAGNAITNTVSMAGSGGTQATFTGGSPVNVHSTLGVFSWLGSIDTSVAWDVTDRWSLWIGYRVVGVGNVAQADGQWPTVVAGPATVSGVEAGSSTIIQGGFAGFEGRY